MDEYSDAMEYPGLRLYSELDDFVADSPPSTTGASTIHESLRALHIHYPQLSSETSTQGALDDVVTDLHRVLSVITGHRGMLAVIHVLPDEILTNIFRIFCLSRDDFAKGRLAWSKIMLVSRRWHNLIMRDGFLWSFIDMASCARLTALDTQLQRAGGWALNIYHDSAGDRHRTFYGQLAADGHLPSRICSLNLNYTTGTLARAVLSSFHDAGLPQLRALSVHHIPDEDDYNTENSYIPDYIMRLPTLRNLRLTDMIVDIHSLQAGLEELHLCKVTLSSMSYDIDTVLGVLVNLPRLRELELNEVIRPAPATGHTTNVHLPHLCTFTIAGPEAVISTFLQRLVIPHTTTVECRMRDITSDVRAAARTILPPLRSLLRHPAGRRLLMAKVEMTILEHHVAGICVAGFDHRNIKAMEVPMVFAQNGFDTAFQYSFGTPRAKHLTRMSRKLFTSLMMHVEILDVRGLLKGPVTASWWKVALLSLRKLHTVHLTADSDSCLMFCQTMIRLMESHPKDFPRLKEIRVDKISRITLNYMFTDHAAIASVWGPDLPTRSSEALLHLARELKERGYLLERMVSREDHTYWPGLDVTRQFKELVGTFIHD